MTNILWLTAIMKALLVAYCSALLADFIQDIVPGISLPWCTPLAIILVAPLIEALAYFIWLLWHRSQGSKAQ